MTRVLLFLLTFITISGHSQEFVSGALITHALDTIPCSILKLKKRKSDNELNYREVQILDSLKQIRKYYPGEIQGYIKEDVVYKSLTLHNQSIFISHLVDGDASLFFYYGASGDQYFFKRQSEANLTILNETVRKNAGFNEMSGRKLNIPIIESDNAFSIFFVDYFKNCPMLANKIRSEFYTIADMKDIFTEYNKSCSKK